MAFCSECRQPPSEGRKSINRSFLFAHGVANVTIRWVNQHRGQFHDANEWNVLLFLVRRTYLQRLCVSLANKVNMIVGNRNWIEQIQTVANRKSIVIYRLSYKCHWMHCHSVWLHFTHIELIQISPWSSVHPRFQVHVEKWPCENMRAFIFYLNCIRRFANWRDRSTANFHAIHRTWSNNTEPKVNE